MTSKTFSNVNDIFCWAKRKRVNNVFGGILNKIKDSISFHSLYLITVTWTCVNKSEARCHNVNIIQYIERWTWKDENCNTIGHNIKSFIGHHDESEDLVTFNHKIYLYVLFVNEFFFFCTHIYIEMYTMHNCIFSASFKFIMYKMKSKAIERYPLQKNEKNNEKKNYETNREKQ